jgi:hypothetical protein
MFLNELKNSSNKLDMLVPVFLQIPVKRDYITRFSSFVFISKMPYHNNLFDLSFDFVEIFVIFENLPPCNLPAESQTLPLHSAAKSPILPLHFAARSQISPMQCLHSGEPSHDIEQKSSC